jgi:FtsH-binding integral membrane protein
LQVFGHSSRFVHFNCTIGREVFGPGTASPVLAVALILLVIAVIVNHFSSNQDRHYLLTWS